jgi:uncharacterized ubiquitin-like protein YukD
VNKIEVCGDLRIAVFDVDKKQVDIRIVSSDEIKELIEIARFTFDVNSIKRFKTEITIPLLAISF